MRRLQPSGSLSKLVDTLLRPALNGALISLVEIFLFTPLEPLDLLGGRFDPLLGFLEGLARFELLLGGGADLRIGLLFQVLEQLFALCFRLRLVRLRAAVVGEKAETSEQELVDLDLRAE
jgi:hypothetical protein